MIPGEYIFDGPDLELNAGRPVVTISVNNTGDRPIQVGSHYHFFETNRALVFDRLVLVATGRGGGVRHAAPQVRDGRASRGQPPGTSGRSDRVHSASVNVFESTEEAHEPGDVFLSKIE